MFLLLLLVFIPGLTFAQLPVESDPGFFVNLLKSPFTSLFLALIAFYASYLAWQRHIGVKIYGVIMVVIVVFYLLINLIF
jgi:hypothetical protein